MSLCCSPYRLSAKNLLLYYHFNSVWKGFVLYSRQQKHFSNLTVPNAGSRNQLTFLDHIALIFWALLSAGSLASTRTVQGNFNRTGLGTTREWFIPESKDKYKVYYHLCEQKQMCNSNPNASAPTTHSQRAAAPWGLPLPADNTLNKHMTYIREQWISAVVLIKKPVLHYFLKGSFYNF